MRVDPTAVMLMYFILPLWLLAGVADWLCHKATHIARTSGPKESFIHLLMFAEIGLPLLAAIFLDVNALIIGLMIVMFLLHEATALWDVDYAVSRRRVTPLEQHVHSFLEMIPLMAILLIVARHWPQFLALFGAGGETARFDLAWKADPLPPAYVVAALVAAFVVALLYFEELFRGVLAKRRIALSLQKASG
ncbi:diguanylate cyclase [Methylocystis sp. JAN1]|uniref:diguanylate cyclase n=1 Tax=Methylocystis sp. JAN1 TaxID=3397211 RepID=UPI003FA20BA2